MCAVSTDYYQSFLKCVLSKSREKHGEGENILGNIKVVHSLTSW